MKKQGDYMLGWFIKQECIPVGCVQSAHNCRGSPWQRPFAWTETPPSLCTDKHLWKHNLRKLLFRAVNILTIEKSLWLCYLGTWALPAIHSLWGNWKHSLVTGSFLGRFFFNFGGHRSSLWGHWYPFNTSGDISSGFQSHDGFLHLLASSPAFNGFLRFSSGATPADLLVTSSMADEPFLIHILVHVTT